MNPIPPSYAAPCPYIPPQRFDVNEALSLAREFCNKLTPCDFEDLSIAYEYLEEIIYNPKFQADPKAYIQQMDIRRGRTEQYCFPEDTVRGFFNSFK